MKSMANTIGYAVFALYSCRAIFGSLVVLALPATSLAQDLNTPVTRDEVNRVYVEKDADSVAALKNAYIGGMMIKAEEEAKMNPMLRDNPKAFANHVQRAAEAARKDTEGVSFRSGRLESVLKGTVSVGAAVAAVPTAFVATPIGAAVLGAGAKAGGDLLVETGLDMLSNKPVEIGMDPEVAIKIRQMMAERAQNDKSPTAGLYRNEFRTNENKDPKSFSTSGETYKTAMHRKEVMLKLAGNDEQLKSLIKYSKTQKQFNEGLEKLSKEQLNKLNGLVEDSKKVVENIQTQKVERDERLKAEERQHVRQELTAGFDGLSGIAKLAGNPVLAEKMKTGGQLAGTLHDISGMTVKGLMKSPGTYLNTTVLAVNLVGSLLGGGLGGGEMAGVMAGIAALQQQIFELKKAMLEEFEKLNIKIDAYFTETFERLDKLQAGQSLETSFVKEIHEQMKKMRELVEDGFHQVILVQLNSVLSGCMIRTSSLTEYNFANCRNVLALVAMGKIKAGMQLSDGSKLPDKIETKGTIKALAEAAALAYPNEFNKNYIVYADDWMWSTEKLLRMATLYPHMKRAALEDGLNSPPILLRDIRDAGERIRGFNYKIAIDQSGKPRTKIFEELLKKYKGDIEQSLSKTSDAITNVKDHGPKFGLTFKDDEFVPTDSDKFFDIKIGMCKGDDGKAKRANFKLKVEECGSTPMFLECGRRNDRTAVAALTATGEQKLNKNFYKFFPPSVLFGARQTSVSSNKRKVTLSACFDRWDILDTRSNHKRAGKFAITLKIGFDYFPTDSVKPVHIDLRDLTTERWVTSPGYYWNEGTPMAYVMWNGGTVGRDITLDPSKPVIDDPNGILQSSDYLDKKSLAKYEHEYEVDLNIRNDGMDSNVDTVGSVYSRTASIKGAMLYILQQYTSESDAALRFYEWLNDETQLPSAEKWNKLLSKRVLNRDQLRAKLESDERKVNEFIKDLGESTPRVNPSSSIEARINQLKQLEEEALRTR